MEVDGAARSRAAKDHCHSGDVAHRSTGLESNVAKCLSRPSSFSSGEEVFASFDERTFESSPINRQRKNNKRLKTFTSLPSYFTIKSSIRMIPTEFVRRQARRSLSFIERFTFRQNRFRPHIVQRHHLK